MLARVLFGMLSLMCLAACGSEPDDRRDCPPAHPTFRLTVNAADGVVPPDIRIEVHYGGGEEAFLVGSQPGGSGIMFCAVMPPTSAAGADAQIGDGGATEAGEDADVSAPQDAGSGEIGSVVCELWTNGPAHVRVEASGHLPVERDLVPEHHERTECGLSLAEVRITLDRAT